jgi:protein involved in polysaccharide export with SLBB domain
VNCIHVIPASLPGILVVALFSHSPPVQAQLLAAPSSPAPLLCRPFTGEGGFGAVRDLTPRIRIGDSIEYISFEQVMDSISLSDTGGEFGKVDVINKIKVGVNGFISMPRIGTFLPVVGLTLPQLQAKMLAELRKQYRNPTLIINQVTQGPIRVNISGQVQSPGSYLLGTMLSDDKGDDNNGQRPNTVQELITRAGGLLSTSDFQAIEVYPYKGKCFTINLDIITNGMSRDGAFALDDGDSIIVRKAKYIDTSSKQFLLMARSDLASNKQRAYVIGDVLKPGLLETNWLSSPMEVIARAGGLLPTAAKTAFLAQFDADTKSYTITQVTADVKSNEFKTGFNGLITDRSVLYIGKSTLANVQQIVQGFIVPAATAVGVSGAVR